MRERHLLGTDSKNPGSFFLREIVLSGQQNASSESCFEDDAIITFRSTMPFRI
jgi:hypothetical protein